MKSSKMADTISRNYAALRMLIIGGIYTYTYPWPAVGQYVLDCFQLIGAEWRIYAPVN